MMAVFSGAALVNGLVVGMLHAGATRHGLLILIKDRGRVLRSLQDASSRKSCLRSPRQSNPTAGLLLGSVTAGPDTAEKFCNERYGGARRFPACRP